jgi:hypothetical protein
MMSLAKMEKRRRASTNGRGGGHCILAGCRWAAAA